MQRLLASLRRAVTYAIALLNVSAIVALKPLISIRLQPLNVGRIGHFLGNTEITLGRMSLGEVQTPRRSIDLWLIDDVVCNKQVLQMRKRDLRVLRLPGGHTTRRLLGKFAVTRRHLIDTETTGLDFHGVYARTSPTLQLLGAEVTEAALLAEKLGLPQGARWVCLAARDSAFLTRTKTDNDWSYHNYRDSHIANYVLAAEALTHLDYYVIRMGREVHTELSSSNKKVIDYATSDHKCDLLDVYLGFGCTFFLSTGSGVEDFAGVARRPRCYVNAVPFGGFRIEEPNSIHITKSHRDAVTNKALTQSELIERGAHNFFESRQYEESQIRLQENSPKEIRDVALEMHSLVSGKHEQSPADKKAQDEFWRIYPLEGLRAPGVPVRTLIGKQFLQDNPQWLK